MTHRLSLAAVGLVLASAAPARAQSLRPNIMFLFDTSGSMHEDSNGNAQADGTTVCPQSTTSRIYTLKSGIRAALQQVGTDEANFGLMSFPELVQNSYTVPSTRNCSAILGTTTFGHYTASPSQTFTVPNRQTSFNHPMANFYQAGCLMSTNNSASQTGYDTWFKTGASEVFHVGVTSAPVGTMPTAAQFDPVGANIASIYKWIDNVEAPTNSGAVTDPELHPNDYTPLGRSLFYANLYFQNEVIPNDPRGSCRHNVIVVATDGDETCDETTAPDSSFKDADCSGGGNFDIYNPINQACLLKKAGVKVYVVTDTTADNANDAIAAAGGTTASIRVSLNDPDAAKSAIVGIIAQNVPPSEICNGADDNCNGLIDEGVSNACLSCAPGNADPNCGGFSMNANDPSDPDNKLGKGGHHCAVEACNCKDDNCNGKVDEGLPVNACGGPCGCAVPTEICNGLDDNCDGQVDNANWPTGPVGAKCNNGLKGSCNRDGILVCTATGTDTVCNAPVVTPQPEICNGLDDDCDGTVDNPPAGGGNLPGVGEACGNGLGACQSGTIICQNGKLVCNVTSTPQPEVCDGIDNDCDGIVDDGNFPQTGQPCLCSGLTQAEVDSGGICKAGHWQCSGALGFTCVGCVLPTPGEVCNGKDNNCDGKADMTGNCPGGYACKDGSCKLECSTGEFPCPLGYKCSNSYCIPQRCAGVSCPTGQQCDEATGSCVDDCAGVTCNGANQTCVLGQCVNCYDPGFQCTNGQLCLDGLCKPDPCEGVTCGSDQYCADGACVALCGPLQCGVSQRCVAGSCVADPCAGVYCKQGEYCNPATAACAPDRCLALQCPAGEACVSTKASTNAAEACIPDPCATVVCPGDCWTCSVSSDGQASCGLKDSCAPTVTNVGQKGGGEAGCSCAVGASGGGPSGWMGLLLGLGLVVGRRRRRT